MGEKGKKGANFSRPERIGFRQECGPLGSLSRSIDTAEGVEKKERVGSGRRWTDNGERT